MADNDTSESENAASPEGGSPVDDKERPLDEERQSLKQSKKGLKAEMDRIRDTAKWMASTLGVIAAVLIAGLDLSNLGSLDCTIPLRSGAALEGPDCIRLVTALVAGAVAILGSFGAVVILVRVFVPQDRTMKDFASLRRGHAVVKWFVDNPTFIDAPENLDPPHPLKWLYDDVQKKRRGADHERRERHTIRQDMALWTCRYLMLRHIFWRNAVP